MPEQSRGNNDMSKINLFFMLHTIPFSLGGQKIENKIPAPTFSMKTISQVFHKVKLSVCGGGND